MASNKCLQGYIRDHYGQHMTETAITNHMMRGRKKLWSRFGDLGIIPEARTEPCN